MKAQTTTESSFDQVYKDRVFFETLGNIYPASQNVTISETRISDVKCYWFLPEAQSTQDIIVYLHGGSFAFGSINSHKAMVSHISESNRSKILFIEYSLAPEHPYPSAINELVRVYEQLIKTYPQNRIIFMGDSAGGGLAVSGIYFMEQRKLRLPDGVILISPWLDLKCNNKSHSTRQALDPILTTQGLLEYAEYYKGSDPNFINPGEYAFNLFPPIFIMVGTNEILYDDSKNFYDFINTIQKNTRFKEYENKNHVWLLTDISSEKSRESLDDLAEFIIHLRSF